MTDFDLDPKRVHLQSKKFYILDAGYSPLGEKYYRFEGAGGTDTLYLNLVVIPVKRKTRRGVWLDYFGTPKFVLNVARKRFAYPTAKLALESFQIRKKWHLRYLASQQSRVEVYRDLALEIGDEDLKEVEK